MKQKARKLIAAILCIAMILPILPVFPRMEVQAAGEIISSLISSMGYDSEGSSASDQGISYYWRDEEFKLIATVKAESEDAVKLIWKSDSEDIEVLEDETWVKSGTNQYEVSMSFKIKEDAKSEQCTLSVEVEGTPSESQKYRLTPQESDAVVLKREIKDDTYVFTGTPNSTFTLLINSNIAIDETFEVRSSKPNVLGIFEEPQIITNPSQYRGCHMVTVTLSVTNEKLTELENGKTECAVDISISSDDELLSLSYYVGQSATKCHDLTLLSIDGDTDPNKLKAYPHIDLRDIYFDTKQIVEFEYVVEGSDVDPPVLIFSEKDVDKTYFDIETTRGEKRIVNGEIQVPWIITMTPKLTTGTKTITLNCTTKSTQANLTPYKIRVYKTDYDLERQPFKIKTKTSNIEGGTSIFIDDSITLITENHDINEVIKWSSGDERIAVVSNTGVLTAKGDGTVDITAEIQNTKSGKRGQKAIFSLTVREKIYPKELTIKHGTNTPNSAMKLYTNANIDTTFNLIKTSPNPSKEVNYEDYDWIIEPNDSKNIITYKADSDKIIITPVGKGNLSVRARTKDAVNNGNFVESNVVELEIIAPISKIDITDANKEFGVTNKTAVGSEYEYLARRGPNDSETEEIEWKITNGSGEAVFISDNDSEVNTYKGDKCRVRYKKAGTVSITAAAVDKEHSGKSSTITVTIDELKLASTLNIQNHKITDPIRVPYTTSTPSEVALYADQKDSNGNSSNEKLTWKLDDPNNVFKMEYLDLNGYGVKLVANKVGTAKIYIESDQATSEMYIIESIIPITKITFTPTSETLGLGQVHTIAPKIEPSNYSEELIWTLPNCLEKVSEDKEKGTITVKTVKTTAPNSLTVGLQGEYSGTKGSFNVTVKRGLNLATVEGVPDTIEYTGTAITFSNIKLCDDTYPDGIDTGEYNTPKYLNNTNSGTASITFTSRNIAYAGTKEVNFEILPFTLDDRATATYTGRALTYTGKEQTPAIVVKATVNGQERTLRSGTEYDLSYTNNLNAGTMTVTVTGKGNYTGTKTVQMPIEGKTITRPTITVADNQYTGSAIIPQILVKDGQTELKNGVDYTYTIANNVNVGSATVTVTGKGNYSGTQEGKFNIVARDITRPGSVDVKLSATDYVYNGKAKKPKVTLSYNVNGKKVTLKSSRDYTVTYTNNIQKSTPNSPARVNIMTKGNFRGNLTVPFYIAEKVSKPKRASISSAKNNKAKCIALKMKKVSGAAGYEIDYSTNKKFTVATTKTTSSKKNSATIKKLKKGSTYHVRVRAFKKNSAGRNVYGNWSKSKKVKIKK